MALLKYNPVIEHFHGFKQDGTRVLVCPEGFEAALWKRLRAGEDLIEAVKATANPELWSYLSDGWTNQCSLCGVLFVPHDGPSDAQHCDGCAAELQAEEEGIHMNRTYLPVPATRVPPDRIVYRKDDRLIVVPEEVAPQALILEAPPLIARDGWAQMPTGPDSEGRTVLTSPDRKLLYVLPLYPDKLTTVRQRVGSPDKGYATEVWHWLPGDATWERGASPDAPEPKEDPSLTWLKASLQRGLSEPVTIDEDLAGATVNLVLLRLSGTEGQYLALMNIERYHDGREVTSISAISGPLSAEYLAELDDEIAHDFEPDPALTEWASAQKWEVVKLFDS